MGQFAPELITALGQVGSGVGAGLTAPNPYQPKYPYAGENSANATMSDMGMLLHLVAPALLDKLGQDVTLPDAVVHNVAPVGGLSLGDVGNLSTAPSLPGLKFGTSPGANGTPALDFPSSHDTSTQGDVNDAQIVDHSIGGQLRRNFGPPATMDSGGMVQTPKPAAKRQSFAPPMPSAQPDQGMPQDPTAAALSLLRHAAQAA